jgi:hypothetical protein
MHSQSYKEDNRLFLQHLFLDVFKNKDDCILKSCPLDLYTPKSSTHNAVTQEVNIEFARQVIREDVEIVNADPFTYNYVKEIVGGVNKTVDDLEI